MKLIGKTATLALMGLVVASFVFVPSALAQVCPAGTASTTLSFESIAEPSQPIKPIVGSQPVEVKVKYAYQQASSLNQIVVDLKATPKAPYAKVTVTPPAQVVNIPRSQEGADGSNILTFKVNVRFTREAPAFEDTDFDLTSTATGGTCAPKPTDVTGKFQAKPDFYGKLSATLDRSIYKSSQNNQVSVPMTIENFGNGQIKAFFDVKGGSGKQKGIQIVTPQPVIVDSPFQGGKSTKQVVKLDVNTPFKNGYMNAVNAVTVDITTRSTDQTDVEGDKAALSLLVRTQGVYVPGFDSVLMLAALVGAAFLVARTRKSA